MQDEDIFQMMKTQTPHLPDDGFSDKVLATLPVSRPWRVRFILASFVLSSLLAFVIWALIVKAPTLSLVPSTLALSTAVVGFWAFVGLFAFVSFEEGVFDL